MVHKPSPSSTNSKSDQTADILSLAILSVCCFLVPLHIFQQLTPLRALYVVEYRRNMIGRCWVIAFTSLREVCTTPSHIRLMSTAATHIRFLFWVCRRIVERNPWNISLHMQSVAQQLLPTLITSGICHSNGDRMYYIITSLHHCITSICTCMFA